MKKLLVIFGVVFSALLLGGSTLQFAQSVPADQGRHRMAISLLRLINTAEATHRSKNGSFVAWKTLLSSHSEYFDKFLEINGLQNAKQHLADAPEILPGWNLRLSVHADGQGYDALLRDTTDDKCGYATLTDENAIIRQSKAVDCEI
jgi:hypothetical protein